MRDNVIERQGLVVFLNRMKRAKSLRRYGNVYYVSNKMKYVVLYCDRDKIEEIEKMIESLPYVERVERSSRPFVATTYENARRDKAKEYDYKTTSPIG